MKDKEVTDKLRNQLYHLRESGCAECIQIVFPEIFRRAKQAGADPFSLSQWEKWQSYCYAR